MRGSVALSFIVLSLFLSSEGTAIEYVDPTRPLSEADRLALKVGEAALIVVGHVVSTYDSTTSVSVAGAESMRHVLVVTFEPRQVLKGPRQSRTMRYVNWKESLYFVIGERPGDRGPTYDQRDSAPMIVFLDDLADWASEGAPVPEEKISRWATRYPLVSDWTESFEQDVRNEVARQQPEAMASRADRIVLAHPTNEHWMDPQPWIVERTLRGEATSRLDVRLVSPESHRQGTNLLFLKKVGSIYEPVSLAGGAVPVRKGRVPRWNCSLDEAIARITR
jgi:hypothetical protein